MFFSNLCNVLFQFHYLPSTRCQLDAYKSIIWARCVELRSVIASYGAIRQSRWVMLGLVVVSSVMAVSVRWVVLS